MQMQHRILLLADTPQTIRRWHLCLSAQGYAVSHINDIQKLDTQDRFDQLLVDVSTPLSGELLNMIPVRKTILLGHVPEPDASRLLILEKTSPEAEVLALIREQLHGTPLTEPALLNTNIGPVLSPAMQATLQQTQRIAAASNHVTITGAAGSGKTSIARTLHAASKHADQQLTELNCAQLSGSLIGKTLFGDPELNVPSAVEQTGTTLLLQHIEQLDFRLQIQLSVCLEQNESPARIIATTCCDPDTLFTDGQLASDLYYQISDICLQVPDLKSRSEDIPRLAEYFLSSEDSQPTLSNSAKQLLLHEPWTGNVAQLKRCMENLLQEQADGQPDRTIQAGDILAVLEDIAPQIPSFSQARAEFERNYLIRMLTFTSGKVSKAARLAQRNRTDFYKLLAKHELNAADFKESAAPKSAAPTKTKLSKTA
ncbi:sigma-54-dependent transcriptional regulator [Aliamphritea spongicola]|uniref:sigma-54-dependent transcriptional regulator n=1 Tax=Aliamphritea spongicola TaxID=707589 RepID=UPI00196AA46F|nr:sigma 54-interacting transcriptional regulator [Aliamphritea spongicola]MBN3561787.1 sigma-54-dependent Fis family transcriptional regulator [Aliamphritea spongicola]